MKGSHESEACKHIFYDCIIISHAILFLGPRPHINVQYYVFLLLLVGKEFSGLSEKGDKNLGQRALTTEIQFPLVSAGLLFYQPLWSKRGPFTSLGTLYMESQVLDSKATEDTASCNGLICERDSNPHTKIGET